MLDHIGMYWMDVPNHMIGEQDFCFKQKSVGPYGSSIMLCIGCLVVVVSVCFFNELVIRAQKVKKWRKPWSILSPEKIITSR